MCGPGFNPLYMTKGWQSFDCYPFDFLGVRIFDLNMGDFCNSILAPLHMKFILPTEFFIALILIYVSDLRCQSVLLNQLLNTACVGQNTRVAEVYFYGSQGCQPDDQGVVFDSGNVDLFSADYSGAYSVVGINCYPSIPGPVAVAGSIYLSTGDPFTHTACGEIRQRFTINLSAQKCSDNVNTIDSAVVFKVSCNPIEQDFKFRILSTNPIFISLSIFDITGHEVRHMEREYPEGTNEIVFDALNLPAGCYWYVAHSSKWTQSGRVVKLAE